jgi:hypothetical protein
MTDINRSKAVVMFAAGAIGGPLALWAMFTDNKIVEYIVQVTASRDGDGDWPVRRTQAERR